MGDADAQVVPSDSGGTCQWVPKAADVSQAHNPAATASKKCNMTMPGIHQVIGRASH
jgi:hypothetical protein